ncbi:group-specific protein [Virgibacillus oceani]|uniref:Group-specific protein n=1 Tax=Virgibacillus oceani TaxID=1479511 RepID=A0A917HIL8_9BACI|nr:group-specific protein [Virgibacillus oceani]GGG80509.1 hypothetical protein GCM10011398_27380 [Virgibacillus oceani]
MGICNIDHSHEDVKTKLTSQKAFLPIELNEKLQRFLQTELSQDTLNKIFHLLKKYDLASKSEQQDRNMQLDSLIS